MCNLSPITTDQANSLGRADPSRGNADDRDVRMRAPRDAAKTWHRPLPDDALEIAVRGRAAYPCVSGSVITSPSIEAVALI